MASRAILSPGRITITASRLVSTSPKEPSSTTNHQPATEGTVTRVVKKESLWPKITSWFGFGTIEGVDGKERIPVKDMRLTSFNAKHSLGCPFNTYILDQTRFCSLRTLPSQNIGSQTFSRFFHHDKRIQRRLRGINQPVEVFKPDERSSKPPKDEILGGCTIAEWKEQRSLMKLHEKGPPKQRAKSNPLGGRPQIRGIVLRTLIKKPKKPNSANRKCVYVRLTTGKEVTCFVPGVGHNLQEHSTVLVRYKRVPDVPGLKLRVIRGVYDCALVMNRN